MVGFREGHGPDLAEGRQPGIPPSHLHHDHRQALPEGAGGAVGRHIHQGTPDGEPHQPALMRRAGQPHMPHLTGQIVDVDQAVAMAHAHGGAPEQTEGHQDNGEGETDQDGKHQGSLRE